MYTGGTDAMAVLKSRGERSASCKRPIGLEKGDKGLENGMSQGSTQLGEKDDE
jgi:hypothetical protein